MSKTLRRDINGKPYFFTPNGFGWGVTSAEKLTDRFGRTYQVWCDENGCPLRCSCPHCFHQSMWCKHLKAIEEIYREQHPEVVEEMRETAIRCGIPVELPQEEEIDLYELFQISYGPRIDSLHPEGL